MTAACAAVSSTSALFATAVIGTSRMPRPSAAFAHLAMRSIATGSALATPTATPRSRAIVSSRPSARVDLGGGRHLRR